MRPVTDQQVKREMEESNGSSPVVAVALLQLECAAMTKVCQSHGPPRCLRKRTPRQRRRDRRGGGMHGALSQQLGLSVLVVRRRATVPRR
jgi:hypothetical protein